MGRIERARPVHPEPGLYPHVSESLAQTRPRRPAARPAATHRAVKPRRGRQNHSASPAMTPPFLVRRHLSARGFLVGVMRFVGEHFVFRAAGGALLLAGDFFEPDLEG